MAHCSHCGHEVSDESGFCTYCGQAMSSDVHEMQSPGDDYQKSGWEQYKHFRPDGFDPRDVEANRYMSLLAYIGVLVIVPLLLRGNSPYTRYHCNQGLALLVVAIAVTLASKVVPLVGGLISFAGGLFVLICMVIGVLNALNGKTTPLPVIGNASFIG